MNKKVLLTLIVCRHSIEHAPVLSNKSELYLKTVNIYQLLLKYSSYVSMLQTEASVNTFQIKTAAYTGGLDILADLELNHS